MSRGLWLKVSLDLPRHAKLFRLARLLGASRRETFFYLCSLWSYAMINYPTGDLPDDPEEIANACDFTQDDQSHLGKSPSDLVNALLTCASPRSGFLERTNAGFHIHDWEQYSGLGYEKREYFRDYRRAERLKKQLPVQQCSTQGSVELFNAVQPVEPDPDPNPDNKIFTSPEPAVAVETKPTSSKTTSLPLKTLRDEFEILWKDYPRKRNSGKDQAFERFTALRRKGEPFDDFRNAVTHYASYIAQHCKSPEYILMFSTFLGPKNRWREFVNDDNTQIEFGGMMEPLNNQHFESDNQIIQSVFGGDANAYARWVSAGSPEPAADWYRRYRN